MNICKSIKRVITIIIGGGDILHILPRTHQWKILNWGHLQDVTNSGSKRCSLKALGWGYLNDIVYQ